MSAGILPARIIIFQRRLGGCASSPGCAHGRPSTLRLRGAVAACLSPAAAEAALGCTQPHPPERGVGSGRSVLRFGSKYLRPSAVRARSACAACPMLRCMCNVSAAMLRDTHDSAANISGLLPCHDGLLRSVRGAARILSRTVLPRAGQVTLRGKMTTSPSLVRSRRASPSASRQVKGGNVTSASPGYCAGAGAGANRRRARRRAPHV